MRPSLPVAGPGALDRLAGNMRGAWFMVASMAGFVMNDTMMKIVLGDLGLFQAICLRGVLATVLLGWLAWRRGSLLLRIGWPTGQLLAWRALGELGGAVCFLTALAHLPIANANAILQALPLAVTLAAALIFGEPVGWRRYAAIGVGMVGVLIIVRPGTEAFTVHSLWAVAAVGFVVLRDLATHRLPVAVPSLFVAFSTAAVVTLGAGLMALTRPWPPITLTDAAALTAAALFVFVGYLFSVLAMRIGEIGFVAPFRYSVVVWAGLSGLLVFGDPLDAPTVLGSAIVVASGIYAWYRERTVARQGRS